MIKLNGRFRLPIVASTIALFFASAASDAAATSTAPGQGLTKDQRLNAIRRAAVWTPTDVSTVDFKKGPNPQSTFDPDAWVECDYKEQKLGGASPKFTCVIAPDKEIKVKYGSTNPEVFGEVLATRLLWGLGFGADIMYPTRVRCHNCPADPGKLPKAVPGSSQEFDPAAIEQKLAGRAMETTEDSGWDWAELDEIGPDAPADARAHRDALKLLAAFIQHGDSRAANQRLLCPAGQEEGENGCKAPLMIIHDVGLTFGKATRLHKQESAVTFEKWAEVPVWKNQGECVAQLKDSYFGRFHSPKISEAGRVFLANLMDKLSDDQIRDLFTTARVHERQGKPGTDPEKTRAADVEEWLRIFKVKRAEIFAAHCPADVKTGS